MFSGRHRVEQDSQGRYFIDRDGKLFHHILTYLRHDKLPPADMAVDVLEEAEYYQVTGLVDWCKSQDSVAVESLKATLEQEEDLQPDGDVLTTNLLVEIARRCIVGKGRELLQHAGKKGVLSFDIEGLFVGEALELLGESLNEVCYNCGGCSPPASSVILRAGENSSHTCTSFCYHRDRPNTRFIVNGVGLVNPVVYVQRMVKRFNIIDSSVQIHLKGCNTHCKRDYIAHKSVCQVCSKAVYSFIFQFLFHPGTRPTANGAMIAFHGVEGK